MLRSRADYLALVKYNAEQVALWPEWKKEIIEDNRRAREEERRRKEAIAQCINKNGQCGWSGRHHNCQACAK